MSDKRIKRLAGGLEVHAFGGVGEVGMNLLGLRFNNEMILLDCGVMFQDLDIYGLNFSLPNFGKLQEFKDEIKAVVFTHGHEDHIGASGLLLKQFPDIEMYASPLTRDLMLSRGEDYPELHNKKILLFSADTAFKVGAFTLTPVCVAHSIPDAYGFVIDSPVGRIILSGDFRYDYDDMDQFKASFGDQFYFKSYLGRPIFCYLGDSTNVDSKHVLMKEATVAQNLSEIIEKHRGGMLIITLFSSNMERMGSILAAAKKHGKKVVLCGRSVRRYLEVAWQHEVIPKYAEHIIDERDVKKHAREDIVAISTGSQAEPKSALMRMAAEMHRHIKLQKGDHVVMSSKFIPGNERAISRMINLMMIQGVSVLTEKEAPIHISGHAYEEESELTLRAFKPKFFIPVHGEYHHLVSHKKLASRLGKDGPEHIVMMRNGQVVNLSDTGYAYQEPFDAGKWTYDFDQLMPLVSPPISQRKRLARYGLIICVVADKIQLFGLGVIVSDEFRDACETYYNGLKGNKDCEKTKLTLLRTFVRRHYRDQFRKRPYVLMTQGDFEPFDFLDW